MFAIRPRKIAMAFIPTDRGAGEPCLSFFASTIPTQGSSWEKNRRPRFQPSGRLTCASYLYAQALAVQIANETKNAAHEPTTMRALLERISGGIKRSIEIGTRSQAITKKKANALKKDSRKTLRGPRRRRSCIMSRGTARFRSTFGSPETSNEPGATTARQVNPEDNAHDASPGTMKLIKIIGRLKTATAQAHSRRPNAVQARATPVDHVPSIANTPQRPSRISLTSIGTTFALYFAAHMTAFFNLSKRVANPSQPGLWTPLGGIRPKLRSGILGWPCSGRSLGFGARARSGRRRFAR